MNYKPKIAIVVSHPIQHFCPQYVSFAENENAEIKVFFGSALGYKKYKDINFNQEISWGNLQLDKFQHVFLNGDAVLQSDKNLDAPALDNELQQFAPDIVIIYGYFQKLQRRALAWAKKNRVKLAYISDSEARQGRTGIKEFIKSFWIKKYFSSISYFLSVGNANEEFYKSYGVRDEQLLRMHFPIDVKAYEEAYSKKDSLRNEIRAKHNIEANEKVLLVVGKLSGWKNQDHVIHALQLLENEKEQYHLFILGSGEKMEGYQLEAAKLTKNKVHFPGFVDIATLPAYYAAADIYVHPASIEPHSIAISEAIYMASSIVLSDRCGSYGESDDVQEGKNGFVFEFGNIAQLAEKIKSIATDDKMQKSFSEFSHQISVEFQQNAHYLILDKLISKGREINN